MSRAYARKVANRILKENQKGRSYRDMAREDYQPIKPGTLNRFAKSKGEWIPKDECILVALGLAKPRAPKVKQVIPEWVKPIKKHIAEMAKQTRQELGWQKRINPSPSAIMTMI